MQIDEVVGTALIYVLAESPYSGYVKVGHATHGTVDNTIKEWPKYKSIPWPITITRRITDIQTGNPRSLVPLAYFQCDSENTAKAIERSVLKEYESGRTKHAANDKKSEWIHIPNEDLPHLIKLLKSRCGTEKYAILPMGESESECNP